MLQTMTSSRPHENPSFAQGDDHPVVNVSFDDAQDFCAWLSKKESSTYRLPTDHEWSGVAGIAALENANASPESKDEGIEGIYPWGSAWPPPANSGNFDFLLEMDSFDNTSPVGKFNASSDGLCDLSGNVWEWCDSLSESAETYRVLRGGSWFNSAVLLSSCRNFDRPWVEHDSYGFRVVLVIGGGG